MYLVRFAARRPLRLKRISVKPPALDTVTQSPRSHLTPTDMLELAVGIRTNPVWKQGFE